MIGDIIMVLMIIVAMVIITVGSMILDYRLRQKEVAKTAGHRFKAWNRQPSRCITCGKRRGNVRHQAVMA